MSLSITVTEEYITKFLAANCNANAGFVPIASGGDGVVTQFWYVGFDKSLQVKYNSEPPALSSSLTYDLRRMLLLLTRYLNHTDR